MNRRIRILDGEPPKQHLIEQREDRGIRTDAEGEREDGHPGKERPFSERASESRSVDRE